VEASVLTGSASDDASGQSPRLALRDSGIFAARTRCGRAVDVARSSTEAQEDAPEPAARTHSLPGMPQQTRVGARAPSLVPAEIRLRLEHGEPSVNHMEQIAMDMGTLLETAFPALAGEAGRLRSGGLVTKMRAGGLLLFEALGEEAWTVARASESDSVRGWGAMAIAACPGLSLAGRLEQLRGFADDPHFAVREWAWLAARPAVVGDPERALGLLGGWTGSDSPRVRRFASEATRPRGVWSAHIPILKSQPELGLPLLLPLKSDPSRYVQDSVANWLNDASKSRPDWVEATCGAWLEKGCHAATDRICRRGMRSLRAAHLGLETSNL
jgi:3-methyladenine DNA glycosylase AlkC